MARLDKARGISWSHALYLERDEQIGWTTSPTPSNRRSISAIWLTCAMGFMGECGRHSRRQRGSARRRRQAKRLGRIHGKALAAATAAVKPARMKREPATAALAASRTAERVAVDLFDRLQIRSYAEREISMQVSVHKLKMSTSGYTMKPAINSPLARKTLEIKSFRERPI